MKGELKIFEKGPAIKMIYIISKKKKRPGAQAPPESVHVQN